MSAVPDSETLSADLLAYATEELHEDDARARRVIALAHLVGGEDRVAAAVLLAAFDAPLREALCAEVPDLINWFHPEV